MNYFVLAQAQTDGGSLMGSWPLMILMVAVLYFFMFRPQQKKQKDQKKMVEQLKKGDEVVTIGGIHGKIYSVEDETVVLEVDKNAKMKVLKSAISLDAKKNKK